MSLGGEFSDIWLSLKREGRLAGRGGRGRNSCAAASGGDHGELAGAG
jgi:hypothetical protein